MKIVKWVLGIVAGLVVLALVGIALLPRQFEVSRSLHIDAPPAVVFAQVVDVRKHELWSPWKAADPTMAFSYPGPTVGQGAVYTWTSGQSEGGRYTITAADPPHRIDSEIDFGEMGVAKGWWALEPDGDGTLATMGFRGDGVGFFGGLFAVMMDAMVGPSFDQGLAGVKALAEAAPEPEPVEAPADTDADTDDEGEPADEDEGEAPVEEADPVE